MLFWISWTVGALAQDALTFEAVRSAVHGQGAPSITFHLRVDAQVSVRLGCGERRFDVSRSVVSGDQIKVPLAGLTDDQEAP